MAEELPQKRAPTSLDQHNAVLVRYAHKLECALLDASKKYAKTKFLYKHYIAHLAHALDKAKVTVPSLPFKLFEDTEPQPDLQALFDVAEAQKLMRDEAKSKQKKSGRPKKQPEAATPTKPSLQSA